MARKSCEPPGNARAAAHLPLALDDHLLRDGRHHLLGMGDDLREEGYMELWHALHGMRVWIMRGPGRAHGTAHERKLVVCL